MGEKRTFIELVDSGATPKHYKKLLDIHQDSFKSYLKLLPRYRLIVKTADDIIEARKKGATSIEILKIRQQLNEDLERLDG